MNIYTREVVLARASAHTYLLFVYTCATQRFSCMGTGNTLLSFFSRNYASSCQFVNKGDCLFVHACSILSLTACRQAVVRLLLTPNMCPLSAYMINLGVVHECIMKLTCYEDKQHDTFRRWKIFYSQHKHRVKYLDFNNSRTHKFSSVKKDRGRNKNVVISQLCTSNNWE
jgi:hypothetical protein